MATTPVNRGRFAKGHSSQGGRPKGVPNKTTIALKEAILAAAEAAGGKDGVVGYLTRLANNEPTAFASLLGKVLPLTITGTGDGGAIELRWLEPTDK